VGWWEPSVNVSARVTLNAASAEGCLAMCREKEYSGTGGQVAAGCSIGGDEWSLKSFGPTGLIL
jgi:hypothetical protein